MTSRQQFLAIVVGIAVCGLVLYPRSLFWSRRKANIRNETIQVDAVERSYRLVMPTARADSKPIPVVFAFHGAGDTTAQMAQYTQLDELADRQGVMVVYLQGRFRNWPPLIPPGNPDVALPDIRFFEVMCERVVSQFGADPTRIYVVGVSQGGAMVNILAAKSSQHIAAAVCHCGWLPEPMGQQPLETTHKCPMLFVVGADDQQVTPAQVHAAQAAFAEVGHPTQLVTIPDFGHGWALEHGINETLWQFLSKCQLSEGEAASQQ